MALPCNCVRKPKADPNRDFALTIQIEYNNTFLDLGKNN